MYTPRMKHVCLIVSIVLLTSVHTAHATTVIDMTFADLVAQAEGIAVGTVSDIREQWDATQQVPITLVTFSNLTVLKGNPGASMTLEFLGGTMPNGLVMMIPGVPRFTVGEKTVVFRTGNQREVCPLVGVWQGLLRVVNNPQQGVETVARNRGRCMVIQFLGGLVHYVTGCRGTAGFSENQKAGNSGQ